MRRGHGERPGIECHPFPRPLAAAVVPVGDSQQRPCHGLPRQLADILLHACTHRDSTGLAARASGTLACAFELSKARSRRHGCVKTQLPLPVSDSASRRRRQSKLLGLHSTLSSDLGAVDANEAMLEYAKLRVSTRIGGAGPGRWAVDCVHAWCHRAVSPTPRGSIATLPKLHNSGWLLHQQEMPCTGMWMSVGLSPPFQPH